jgi:hypothetical protein
MTTGRTRVIQLSNASKIAWLSLLIIIAEPIHKAKADGYAGPELPLCQGLYNVIKPKIVKGVTLKNECIPNEYGTASLEIYTFTKAITEKLDKDFVDGCELYKGSLYARGSGAFDHFVVICIWNP